MKVFRTHYETIDSTHLEARRIVERILDSGIAKQGKITAKQSLPLLLTSDEQTAGIGQRENLWRSPTGGNIYATFVFPWAAEDHSIVLNVSQVATISVAQTLEEFGFEPKIKWINDVLLNNKKCSGVLSEYHQSANSIMLISMGINVNMQKEECDKIERPITSLSIEAQDRKPTKRLDFNCEKVLSALILCLGRNLEHLKTHGFNGDLYDYLQRNLAYVGSNVTLLQSSGKYFGKLVGITESGAILIQSDGEKMAFNDGRLVIDP